MRRGRDDYDWRSRLERAFTQRIYLMEAEEVEENSYRFKVMGNTGKPYDITIRNGEDISCTCPDHRVWNNFCKHLMLLLIRVIGIPQQDVFNHYYRDGNFTVGCETIHPVIAWFDRKENAANSMGELEEEPEIPGQVKRKPIEDDDDCPVCYESFAETKDEQTNWCRAGCGKSVHQSCFLKWSQALGKKYGSRKTLGCVWCRTEWVWNN
jgi:hypothetical protein